ncbi:MAG TPA: hypothetical protein VFF69_10300 [Phycisphaerales bacterium]|nr:hypothetical protein [Phycisphaerales bacterium]
MRRTLRLAAIVACVHACGAAAQTEKDGDGSKESDAPTLPTLDELLGIGRGASETEQGASLPGGEAGEELDRLLSGGEIADEFRAAVDLMGRSAARLDTAGDTGVRTQRMQEDVLRKLDKLIADAESRAQQSSSSSSSSSQAQQQAQNQPNQRGQQQTGTGDNRAEMDPPGLRTGPIRPEDAADLAAWGSLPARVRDALVQGSGDQFSATYRKLTEAYYRMLAEEPKQ